MKFLALLFAVVVAAHDEEFWPSGPEPNFSHTEFLGKSIPLTASEGRPVTNTFKASSADAIWMRLAFEEVELPQDARISIRSTFDGHVQYLNAETIKQWSFHSAYFNGDEVEVTVEAKSRATLAVKSLIVGENPPMTYRNESKRTLCFSTDNRQRAQSRTKDARFVLGSGYCSAWLIDDQFGCFLSAGHCGANANAVFQFNVPDSTSSGGVQNPSPEFQFPIDINSNQGVNGGLGNDWRYVGSFRNSNTGLTPRQQMGTNGYILSTATSTPAGGSTWQLYGHGSATGSTNLVLKGSQGAFSSRSGNRLNYRVSTTGGDSGSGVTYPASGGDSDGTAVGIHTHGGCTSTGGANAGTWIQHPDVQAALRSPRGVCQTGM